MGGFDKPMSRADKNSKILRIITQQKNIGMFTTQEKDRLNHQYNIYKGSRIIFLTSSIYIFWKIRKMSGAKALTKMKMLLIPSAFLLNIPYQGLKVINYTDDL